MFQMQHAVILAPHLMVVAVLVVLTREVLLPTSVMMDIVCPKMFPQPVLVNLMDHGLEDFHNALVNIEDNFFCLKSCSTVQL